MRERTERADVELYLLRHAHAGNPDEWTGDDSDRPLSAKGRRQAERLGRFLAELGFVPDVILTSPKARALQTAELVAGALGVRFETDNRLGGRLEIDLLSALVEDAGGNRVMVVGHDPDFSDLCASLSGADYLRLKKGALARIDAPMPLRAAAGVLRWLVPPDLLSSDSA
jgi:phosphohistidine phosphatase